MGGCSSKNTVKVDIARKMSENKEGQDAHNDSTELNQRLNTHNKRSRANTATTQNSTEHFDETKIVKVALQGSSSKFISEIHFNAGTAPLAPIKEGGAYILYSEKSTGQLKVIQIDNDGNKTGQDIDLGIKGAPFDIISVPWGFVILGNEKTDSNHKLFVMGFSKEGKTKFSRTLIHCNSAPSSANKDQIMFHNKDAQPMFGLKAIYDPHNGRLAWLNGRIGIIFAHYNYFGDKDGKRDVHTGDTFITLDENGKDEKVGFAWGTSHSLNQQLFAHENYYITVSLGDAYPVNIKGYRIWNDQENVSAIDPVTYKKNSLASMSNLLIEGDVVGNGQGGSCGRLGGLVYLKSKNLFAFAYSRRKCKDSYGGHEYNNEKNELAIVYMDEYLNVVKTVVIGDGEFINQIKTAKYGNNLLIQYSTTQRKDPRYPNNQYLHYAVAKDDQTYMMMVDLDGKLITPPKLMSDLQASPSDDFEELSDGRVAWTFVDPNSGEISYFYYGPPLTEETPIKSNSAELAQKPENVKKLFGAFGMHNCLEKVPVEIISPLTPCIRTSEKSIAVDVKCPPEVKIYINFEDFEGKKYEGLTRIVKDNDNISHIHALLPKNGEFKLVTIFEIQGTPHEWVDFYVNANMKELPDPKRLGYADVLSKEIVLLEPWTRYLKKGSTQHFKVQSNKVSEVIAIVNGKWLQIPKNEDVFEGDVELNEKEGDFYIWIKHEGDSNAHSAIKYQIYN